MSSPRLAPLLSQLDTSLEMGLERMAGLSDEEYHWPPAPGAVGLKRRADGTWEIGRSGNQSPSTRTIAWLAAHLGEMGFHRADYVDGDHRLTPDDFDAPVTAAAGEAYVLDGWARWRLALDSLSDAELDVVGRSAFPWGLDPQLPILDIAWWMNRELIHHLAEIAVIRDLWAARDAPG